MEIPSKDLGFLLRIRLRSLSAVLRNMRYRTDVLHVNTNVQFNHTNDQNVIINQTWIKRLMYVSSLQLTLILFRRLKQM